MVMSPRMIQSVLAERSEETEIILITISHDSWDDDVRICSLNYEHLFDDPETNRPVMGVRSRGKEYLYAGLTPVLPNSQEESAPECSFKFSNIDKEVSSRLAIVDDTYPLITLELTSTIDTDSIEMVFPDMHIRSASWNSSEATISIFQAISTHEASPWARMTKMSHPTLYQ